MREVLLLRTEFDAGGLPLLRSLVEEVGLRTGLAGAVRGALVQAVAEIAADAVEHGSGAGTVGIRSLDGALCCEVTEHGPGATAERSAGLGPRLAEALVTAPGAGGGRVRVHGTARGTSTTLSVPLPASATAPPATAPPAR
ncbi:ATP-binding protein [Streptomyces scabiei]|nr:ATP-binding protein [Streptomyces scabiei]MDX2534192.1 ATP-binding protein [Streptomyces scabiei]MDX2575642.1 ATP-binding protein [Streptomyces scabiei]MDX2651895.1 ATP-binding protein [Streptomyces scabiei]MDX2719421.1 ATP-binding protein [Streptomyces scabiei]MDX2796151.1 ATP-binding protein [Streptomyces scabiei]